MAQISISGLNLFGRLSNDVSSFYMYCVGFNWIEMLGVWGSLDECMKKRGCNMMLLQCAGAFCVLNVSQYGDYAKCAERVCFLTSCAREQRAAYHTLARVPFKWRGPGFNDLSAHLSEGASAKHVAPCGEQRV